MSSLLLSATTCVGFTRDKWHYTNVFATDHCCHIIKLSISHRKLLHLIHFNFSLYKWHLEDTLPASLKDNHHQLTKRQTVCTATAQGTAAAPSHVITVQHQSTSTIQYNTIICNTHKVEYRTSNLRRGQSLGGRGCGRWLTGMRC